VSLIQPTWEAEIGGLWFKANLGEKSKPYLKEEARHGGAPLSSLLCGKHSNVDYDPTLVWAKSLRTYLKTTKAKGLK
jgi:hypothetical protein